VGLVAHERRFEAFTANGAARADPLRQLLALQTLFFAFAGIG
jgi:hypothetical protein